ncbi:AAA family ATPase [Sediminibacillus terrae]|uniref:AAA family ATPase n=1 Tax=Sediminibacillus terrae TaxID=1562106 RepID=UPI0013872C56|nr:AAA family ATPase [Sediminibacillus terrae]
MKKIQLLELHLRNFKGIKEFSLKADGQDLNIFAQNEGGKTTIFDGFTWLLFNKGSNDDQDFGIKTIKDGEVVHNLDHEVEGLLDVDGKVYKLKKTFKEKWTQKKGSGTKEFTGHTTKHFINGVPGSKKEYDDTIREIIGTDQVDSFLKRYKKMKVETVFKLLTVPNFFVNGLHWRERRDLLLEITGDISDEEILDSEAKFQKLKEALNGNSIDGHKEIIASKKREINEKLNTIPDRIDENHHSIPDISDLDKASLESKLEGLNGQVEAKQQQINDIRNGSEVNTKRKAISDIDLELTNIKNEHNQNGQQEIYSIKSRIQEEQSNVSILQSKIKGHQQQKQMNEGLIARTSKEQVELREEWHEESKKEFQHDVECECPTCGQDLPGEQVEAAREKAQKDFNLVKARKLEAIQNRGLAAKEKVEKTQVENEKIEKEITTLNGQIEVKQDAIKQLEDKLVALESNVTDITENPAYVAKLKEKQAIEEEISQMQQSVESSIKSVQQEIVSIKEQQSAVQIDLSKIEQVKNIKNRIAELEEQQRALAAEYEKLEQELDLIDGFTNKKVTAIDEKVSKYFEITRFKMLEKQVNGGLDEKCEPTYKGVAFTEGLNDGAKVSVGFDIINVLSRYFDIQAPIFFDNAEQVTKFLVEPEAQIIALYAHKDFEQLHVMPKSGSMKEAI